MKTSKLSILIISTSLVTGCATTKGPRMAQSKQIEINGETVTIAGSYHEKKNQLSITINGDPVMRGKFAPFTPTKKMNAKYNGASVSSSCYFGSVLAEKGGLLGVVAGAVQSSKSATSDKCEISVDGKMVEALYF